MEDRKQVSLQNRLEINQHVPATNQIQFAKGRVLKDVVLGKNNHLTDIMVDDVLVPLSGKKTGKTRH